MEENHHSAGLPAGRDSRYVEAWAAVGTLIVLIGGAWIVASLLK